MTARGASLNNPLNLMHNAAFQWQGEIVPTADPQGRLCQFDTVENGIRAGTVNLLSYYLHDECDTVRSIITRYAPSNENNTEAYIAYMGNALGVDSDTPLTMTNKAFLNEWVFAQIHYEQGADVCTAQQIADGINAAITHSVS